MEKLYKTFKNDRNKMWWPNLLKSKKGNKPRHQYHIFGYLLFHIFIFCRPVSRKLQLHKSQLEILFWLDCGFLVIIQHPTPKMSLAQAAGALLRPQTPLQQLLEDINFQRNKEMRQLLKDGKSRVANIIESLPLWFTILAFFLGKNYVYI